MKTIHQVILVFIVTLFLSCESGYVDTNNLNNKPEIIDTPRSFVKNYGVEDTTRLFAFVGEKISVDILPSPSNSFDNIYKAKYRILEKVYGSFPEDTIEFVVYDHYGMPSFEEFKNVLLYVFADRGTYHHHKYVYNSVYLTKEGHWAGAYPTDDYGHAYNKRTKIKPVKIQFAENVSFPIDFDTSEIQREVLFPSKFYKIVDDSAFPVYGNYVGDLFTLSREGILTARGVFEPNAQQEEDMVEEMQPEPRKTPPSADDLKFIGFWEDFVESLNESGLKNFKQIILDTLYICDKLLPANKFIDQCFNQVIDGEVKKRIADRTKLDYTSDNVEFDNLLTFTAQRQIIKHGKNYRFRQMLVTRSTKNNNPPEIVFSFIETKKGYRLYGIDHHWFKECCN